jgi:nucleotide-binding universal stress UspA family protein
LWEKGVQMRVLYATDGSSAAREGEALITSLFDPSLAEIWVLTVKPEHFHDPLVAGDVSDTAPLDLPVLDAARVAGTVAERLSRRGFAASSSTARGDPALEILRVIESGPYDLVVLGSSRNTWMDNLLLGRVSMHVLHHAPCSVVVTNHAPTDSGRVLVGADGSIDATSSMTSAMRILDRGRCLIEVATVVSYPWMLAATSPAGTFMGHATDLQGLERQRINEGRVVAQRASKLARSAGFKLMEEAVLVGRPGSQLLKEADSIGADLIVVGSRGHGAVSRAILGSVSDQVVRHAPATFVGRIGPVA